MVGISHILTLNNMPRVGGGHRWSIALENWLDRERDQLPLWLPQSCRPKWIKADRALLEQTGGLAIYLAKQRVITAKENRAHMPWVQAAKAAQQNADLHQ